MLSRLTINVTQYCNLACLYCYANGGNYRGHSKKIDAEKSISIILNILETHKIIKTIQYFGGEPLLNFKAIKLITERIYKFYQDGLIQHMPNFSIITNLTILENEHIELFKKFDFTVIVSIDGTREINDKLRFFKQKGSIYNLIIKNINLLNQNKIKFEVAATYTKLHIDSNISIIDLILFFSTFKPDNINITNVISENESLNLIKGEIWHNYIKLQMEAISYVFNEWNNGNIIPYNLITETINSLKCNTDNYFCPAGLDNLALSSDYKIGICHMFTNNGNLFYNNIEKISQIDLPTKDTFIECKDCWVKDQCRICIGRMYNNKTNKFNLDKSYCLLIKNIVFHISKELTKYIPKTISTV